MSYFDVLGERAKQCKNELAFASTQQKNDALLEIAHILRNREADILAANAEDIERARQNNMK